MSKWEVTLKFRDTTERVIEIVEAETEVEAGKEAVKQHSIDWEPSSVTRLCDFCEPAPHPNCEAYTEVTVTDPSDVLDEPPGNDAPARTAWVCHEHFEVIENLPTLRSQT